MPGGRPSGYSPELGEKICSEVAAGRDVKSVCQDVGISLGTLHVWREVHREFFEAYARARARSGEASESRIQGVIDKLAQGEIDANAARVMVDAEKWLAAKRAPRTHGDRVEVEHSGSVQGMGAVCINITAAQAAPVLAACAPVLDVQPEKPALPDVVDDTGTALTDKDK